MAKFGIFVLVAFFMYSAMTLVSVRYEQRQLFTELERLSKETRELETKWRFLELERANLTNTISVDHVIKEKLKMISPATSEIIYIKENELEPAASIKPEALEEERGNE